MVVNVIAITLRNSFHQKSICFLYFTFGFPTFYEGKGAIPHTFQNLFLLFVDIQQEETRRGKSGIVMTMDNNRSSLIKYFISFCHDCRFGVGVIAEALARIDIF